MPFKESSVMDERMRFILEQEGGLDTMTDLCEAYGISRETGYYWLRRYREGGVAAPSPAATSQPDAGKNPGSSAGAATSAHELGAAEVKTRVMGERAAARVAGIEHHRRDAGARRIDGAAQEAAPRSALH